jgi:hypothetical protein
VIFFGGLQHIKAQDYFGIVDAYHSAEAASLDLPYGLCKVKGDLLLIEMAVNEVSLSTCALSSLIIHRLRRLCVLLALTSVINLPLSSLFAIADRGEDRFFEIA